MTPHLSQSWLNRHFLVVVVAKSPLPRQVVEGEPPLPVHAVVGEPPLHVLQRAAYSACVLVCVNHEAHLR